MNFDGQRVVRLLLGTTWVQVVPGSFVMDDLGGYKCRLENGNTVQGPLHAIMAVELGKEDTAREAVREALAKTTHVAGRMGRPPATVLPIRDRVWGMLCEAGDRGLTVQEAMAQLDVSRTAIYQALNKMVAQNRVRRGQDGVRRVAGRPVYKYWRRTDGEHRDSRAVPVLGEAVSGEEAVRELSALESEDGSPGAGGSPDLRTGDSVGQPGSNGSEDPHAGAGSGGEEGDGRGYADRGVA